MTKSEPGFQKVLIRLLNNVSIEVPARDPAVIDVARDRFDPGTDVTVAYLPDTDPGDIVQTAVNLQRAGFNPVPHVPARLMADGDVLDDFLARLTGEAGVRQALLIGGDADRPAGAFTSTLEMLDSGAFEDRGFTALGFAGHPEGHPRVADNQVMLDALGAKIRRARELGAEPYIVTQFCFEAAPILAWLGALKEEGIDCPVRIGTAGPASAATLVRYAIRCGIGNSLRAIRSRTNMIGRLLSVVGPEELLKEVSIGLAELPDQPVMGIHFFPFGGLAKTSDAIAEALTRLYAQITTIPA
jgi:methylenetetrahydrofolate reductase (NADPH)